MPRCGWQGDDQGPWSLVIGLLMGLGNSVAVGITFLVSGTPGWLASIIPGLAVAGGAVALGSLMGAMFALAFVVGWCLARANHLKDLQDPVCVAGIADAADNSEDHWYYSIFWDPDRSIDLVVKPQYLYLISDQAAYVRCNSVGTPLLHIEIPSSVQDAVCIGGIIGAAVGAALGIALAVAAAAALGCGPLSFLCFLLALLIAALVSLAGAYIGGVIGGAIGKAVDSEDELLKQGEMVERGTCLTVQGAWITDKDHGWNEVHPVRTLKLSAKYDIPRPLVQQDADLAADDCPLVPPPVG